MKRDVLGQRFGRLVALRHSDDSRNYAIWKCDCGSEKRIYIYSVLNGDSRSCGCLNLELIASRNVGPRGHIDLSGQRFGRLLAIEIDHTDSRSAPHWKCLCDCGNTKVVSAHSLRICSTKSCGCLQKERAKQAMTKHGQYKEKNYLAANSSRRRAIKRGATVEVVDPAVVYDRDIGLCQICGLPVEDGDFSLDHRIPLTRGGEHSYANCGTAHLSCNSKKHRKLPEQCDHLWLRN